MLSSHKLRVECLQKIGKKLIPGASGIVDLGGSTSQMAGEEK